MGTPGDDPKEPDRPSWQHTSEEPSQQSDQHSKSPARESLLEKARKFVLEDPVRDATTDKKIAFLEEKGLTNEEIQELLGISRNSSAPDLGESSFDDSKTTQPSSEKQHLPTLVPSTTSPVSSPVARDAPPVITYPEFLITPPQPAPLVTAKRLLNTVYAFGTLSVLLYGTANYIVAPLAASLTSSRHDLAGTAQANLDKLITKLEGSVSQLPEDLKEHRSSEDDEDSDSDPTELFHRDIGVQTSLPSSPSNSRPTSPPPLNPLESQMSKMGVLISHIKELNDDCNSEANDVDENLITADVLRDYLNTLAFPTTNYQFGGIYGKDRKKEDENDLISQLKADIRSVKGGLLSTRSFPGTTSRGR